jgi:hypothetical protein
MTTIRAALSARQRLTICLLTGGILLVALIVVLTRSSQTPQPITPALLETAAQAAEAQGRGYDYTCELYGAPRQILCEGQGATVTFLVSPTGQLQPEPETG